MRQRLEHSGRSMGGLTGLGTPAGRRGLEKWTGRRLAKKGLRTGWAGEGPGPEQRGEGGHVRGSPARPGRLQKGFRVRAGALPAWQSPVPEGSESS